MKKNCLVCQTPFSKNPKESLKQWDYRKFCSLSCGAKSPAHKGHIAWNKGNHTRLNDALINWYAKGNKSWNAGKKGLYKPTLETRLKQSASLKKRVAEGKHNNYKGGIERMNSALKHSLAYSLWRKAVLRRDNFTCQKCKQYGGKLQVDHELPFALFPDLRLEVLNGRVLCYECHRKTETWGVNANKSVWAL